MLELVLWKHFVLAWINCDDLILEMYVNIHPCSCTLVWRAWPARLHAHLNTHANIFRYAVGKEYHRIINFWLKPICNNTHICTIKHTHTPSIPSFQLPYNGHMTPPIGEYRTKLVLNILIISIIRLWTCTARPPRLWNHPIQVGHCTAPSCSLTGFCRSLKHLICLFLSPSHLKHLLHSSHISWFCGRSLLWESVMVCDSFRPSV